MDPRAFATAAPATVPSSGSHSNGSSSLNHHRSRMHCFEKQTMELKLEVLHGTGLSNGSYRVGDFTTSLLGYKELNPYVVVQLNDQLQQSIPIKAGRGGSGYDATMTLKTFFEVTEGAKELTFQVFDRKSWQAVIRGDPLIGEASLTLPQVLSQDSVEDVVHLKLNNKQSGELKIRYGLVQPVPSLDRIHSSESFESLPEDQVSQQQNSELPLDDNKKQCEAVAKRYMEARMSNDLAVLQEVLSSSAVIEIQKPWGGSASYCGWDQCQEYFKESKAEPGVNFRHWKHSETEMIGCGDDSTTTVRWVGQAYKLGWRNVKSSITVDSQKQITQIHLVPSLF